MTYKSAIIKPSIQNYVILDSIMGNRRHKKSWGVLLYVRENRSNTLFNHSIMDNITPNKYTEDIAPARRDRSHDPYEYL